MENTRENDQVIQESVFSNWVIIPVFFSLITTLLLPATSWYILTSNDAFDIIGGAIAFLFELAIWIVMVWGELRLKALRIYFKTNSIEIRPFLGLGKKTLYSYNEISGFTIGLQPAYPLPYEYITLIGNKKRILRISQFYFRNYKEIKLLVIEKFENYQIQKFSLRKLIAEIFED